MSNWFKLATWPIAKGDEITWRHFEDIRRAIFIIRAALVYAAEVPEGTAWEAGSYAIRTVRTHGGIFWVSSINSNTEEPVYGSSWYPNADTNNYLHYCRNSLYHTYYHCSHSPPPGIVDYFPEAYRILPTQVWQLTNCVHFADHEDAHDYKAGDKIKVTDTVFAYQGMHVGYICKLAHTSSGGNKPIANFTSPTNSTYWKQYGDPVEVSTKPYVSGNHGSKYPDFRGYPASSQGSVGQQPYKKSDSGWPDDGVLNNELHKDASYAEYQAAIERVCEGGWIFFTNSESVPYYYDPATIWEKPPIAMGSDWNWDCNRSTFELVLKFMDNYDWYWDDVYYPFNWHNPPGSSPHDEGCDWCKTHGEAFSEDPPYWPSHPVWRRTWRYAMTKHADEYENLSIYRDHANISGSHNGQVPPEEPTGGDDTAAHTYHTLKEWHANPFAGCLNDMHDALDALQNLHLNWEISVEWYMKYCISWAAYEAYTSGEVAAASDARMRDLIDATTVPPAWPDAAWHATNGGEPNWYVEMGGGWVEDPLEGHLDGFVITQQGYGDPATLNKLKLIITMTDALPRNAGIAGGCYLTSTAAMHENWSEHATTPGSPPTGSFNGVSYHEKMWGGIPVLFNMTDGYFERHPCSFPSGGGTMERIFEPEGTALTPDYALPQSCSGHDLEQCGQGTRAYAYGNFSVDLPTTYIVIDKDFAIL